MKTTELKKHHEELNLPVGIRLEIMEAHAERLEAALVRIAGQAVCAGMDGPDGDSRMLENCYDIAESALANQNLVQPAKCNNGHPTK